MRPMTVEEMPTFYRWSTQSEATPFWYGELQGDKVPSYEEFLRDWQRYYFDGSEPEKGRSFVILVGNRTIGQINYNEINREDNSVELDIIIAEDRDKNKGYGTDALLTLTGYLFKRMSIETCWIEVVTKNPRAIRAYEKAGFRRIKTFMDGEIGCIRMELKKQ